jgi:hypothetical protein
MKHSLIASMMCGALSAGLLSGIPSHLLVPSFALTPNRGRPSTATLVGLAAAVVILLFAMWKTSQD